MPSANARPPIIPRLFLQQAMVALEGTLQRNDGKPDWLLPATNPADLEDKLGEEVDELLDALNDAFSDNYREAIQAEALDVAAVALMLWHAAGGSNTVNRGREVNHGG